MRMLYDKIAFDCNRNIMTSYSTSFSLGARLFARDIRKAISAIYGFVRVADEIVDTFADSPQRAMLDEFTGETWKAIQRRISANPVLHAFQLVVHQYQIEHEHIASFLKSMKMDLDQTTHDRASYDNYIYGSAEVVGLMCLHVFVRGNHALYLQLKPAAMKLGSAFQKVNFLRDIRQDANVLGRQYFPELRDNEAITEACKLKIETEIQKEFDEAFEGIRKLPKGSKLGVYVAYIYYRKLLGKIKNVEPHDIMNQRIRVPDVQKIGLLLWSVLKYRLHLI